MKYKEEGLRLENKRVIIASILLVVLLVFAGCNKIDKTSVANNSDFSIDKISAFSEEQPYEEFDIKPNIIFYLLIDEYLENNDVNNPNVSELTRVFIRYDGVEKDITPHSITVFLEKVNSLQEFRYTLNLKNPSYFNLPPNTIVSDRVLGLWELQQYDGLGSYSDESPKGLTYSKIK